MRFLVDKNVLLRIAQVASNDHLTAKAAVVALANAGIEFCVVPQVIYEFWVAATRPVDVNGLGMDIATAETSILEIVRIYRLLRDERGVFGNWHSLVVSQAVRGKSAHDARLVAAMQRHGVANLLTFKGSDFSRFSSISVYSPKEVLAGKVPV